MQLRWGKASASHGLLEIQGPAWPGVARWPGAARLPGAARWPGAARPLAWPCHSQMLYQLSCSWSEGQGACHRSASGLERPALVGLVRGSRRHDWGEFGSWGDGLPKKADPSAHDPRVFEEMLSGGGLRAQRGAGASSAPRHLPRPGTFSEAALRERRCKALNLVVVGSSPTVGVFQAGRIVIRAHMTKDM